MFYTQGSERDETSCIDISSFLKDKQTDENAQSDDGYSFIFIII